jgi:hypothetical protein
VEEMVLVLVVCVNARVHILESFANIKMTVLVITIVEVLVEVRVLTCKALLILTSSASVSRAGLELVVPGVN